MALDEQKYILLTSFRRDGTPASGGTAHRWARRCGSCPSKTAGSGSGPARDRVKAKRLAHTGRVTVQPCDVRGRVTDGTSPTDATTQLVTGADYEAIQQKVRAKYGLMTTTSKLLDTVGGTLQGKGIPYGDRGVVTTLAG